MTWLLLVTAAAKAAELTWTIYQPLPAAAATNAPTLVIPSIQPLDLAALQQAALFGSILPATWSFMLAARERGLGTCWTTLHLMYEKEAAEILGIPYDDVTQVALIPIAHTLGTNFRQGPRKAMDGIVHWNQW